MTETERLEGQVRLLKRIIERLPLCPDHRDKVRDVCCWCEMERQQRLTAGLLEACKRACWTFENLSDAEEMTEGDAENYRDLLAAIAKAEGREA